MRWVVGFGFAAKLRLRRPFSVSVGVGGLRATGGRAKKRAGRCSVVGTTRLKERMASQKGRRAAVGWGVDAGQDRGVINMECGHGCLVDP